MWQGTGAAATAGGGAEEDHSGGGGRTRPPARRAEGEGGEKAAADAEHAGDESDCEPDGQDDEDVDRQLGDRKVDLHGSSPSVCAEKRASTLDRSRGVFQAQRGRGYENSAGGRLL